MTGVEGSSGYAIKRSSDFVAMILGVVESVCHKQGVEAQTKANCRKCSSKELCEQVIAYVYLYQLKKRLTESNLVLTLIIGMLLDIHGIGIGSFKFQMTQTFLDLNDINFSSNWQE